MADITRSLFRRHLRGGPTTWTRHSVGGRVRHEGVGLSYGFRERTAVLSEVPVDDRELSLVAHARTADHAEISLPLGITYRVAEPELAVRRLDFGIDPRSGRWRANPIDALVTLLGELGQEPVLTLMAGTTLQTALMAGPEPVRRVVAARLAGDERLAELGVAVVGVRVLAVRAAPELERALQTPTREAAQTRADEATYQRRADAVERERAIAENELESRIELARREERLVEQRGANTRRGAEFAAAAEAVAADAAAARARVAAATEAERIQAVGAAEVARDRGRAVMAAERIRAVRLAEADGEAARVAALRDVPVDVLGTLALRELAAKLPEIGQLTITPDVLTGLVGRLTAAPDRGAASTR